MNVLANKVAVVTGASSGIGRATAKLFASEGAKVVVSARRQAELDALVGEIEADGGQAIPVAGDVKSEQFAKDVVDAAVDCFGGLDIAYNNAGSLGAMGPVADVSFDAWRETLDTSANLPGATEDTRGFIERLHALKRLAQPEEIAQTVLHLASEASSFITGIALLADGGVSVNRS